MHPTLEHLRGGLIVSCQADNASPVHGPRFMAAFARCAEMGGAVGIRANGPADVRASRNATSLPIIGIKKLRGELPVFITPTFASAKVVAKAGAGIIALDATHRPRAGNVSPEVLIARIQRELGCLVMADIDTLEEGLRAEQAGADIVATTLSGYTEATRAIAGGKPDLKLVRALARRVRVPVICEGRVSTPSELGAALDAGAFAVVVGTSITNPIAIARAFALAAKGE